MKSQTMKYLPILCLLFLISCDSGNKKNPIVNSNDSVESAGSVITPEVNPTVKSFGDITIHTDIQHGDTDETKDDIKSIEYKVLKNDSLLTTIRLERSDFIQSNEGEFNQKARLFRSEIRAVDGKRERIIIDNSLGVPDTDWISDMVVIADFKGKKTIRYSPHGCIKEDKLTFGKMVDCAGVYDYEKVLFTFPNCCTVYSRLINDTHLFYVGDWSPKPGARDFSKDNAFLINIYTKDTLEHFVFKDYNDLGMGYSAQIAFNEPLGILVMVQEEQNLLTTWDSRLTRKTYKLSEIRTNNQLTPSRNVIEIIHEYSSNLLIELDRDGKPIGLNWK